jgi:multidrug transporter EmrE-like cation transporter
MKKMIADHPGLSRVAQGLVILLAVAAVAVADVLLKRAAAHGNLKDALSSPWLLGAVILYALQIGLFTIAFVANWKLSIVGALQTAFYALIVLAAGVLLYDESLTRMQVVGILMTLGGVVLINLR